MPSNSMTCLKSILLILFIASQAESVAQSPAIKAIARIKRDSVILRWGPTAPLAWDIANKTGYLIKRYTVVKDGTLEPAAKSTGVLLTPSPIKPWPLEKWEAIAKKDKYAAIAAQALYGKTFALSNPSSNTVQFINQSAEQENRWSFALFTADQSMAAATGMGLRFVDRTIKQNEKYLYRILVAQQNKNYPIDSGAVFVDPAEKMELPPPEEVKAEFGDLSVALSWNTLYHQSIYSSYKVERSGDEGKTFMPADDLSFTTTRPANGKESHLAYYLDSLQQNNKVYFYRVVGITPFGETGPPSAVVKGTGLGSANGVIPVVTFTHAFNDGGTLVQWRYPKENMDRINGFTVGRASSAKGPFIDITPKVLGTDKDSFVDKKPGPINYYVVRAIGKDGKTATSFPYMVQLEDNTPPAAPTSITGKIDQKGNVILQWANNTEQDLAGYRVFRANSPTEEFVQVTKEAIATASFTDSISLQTLTKKIYYRIVATDNRFNLSDYSKIIALGRPDIVPPSASLFSKAESVGSKIELEWLPSVSDDVAAYQLYRSNRGDTTRTLIKELRNDSTRFADNNVVRGNQYRYELIVKDSAGLKSTPTFISVNCIDNGLRPAIAGILSKVDREGRKIVLQWKYPTDGLRGFQVYRASGESPMRLYKFVEPDKIQFIDKELRVNTTYTYTLKAIFKNGAESEMSEGVTLNY
jgi:uncharacterized protein